MTNRTDRLDEENDHQWLGFCCYRNLNTGRSLITAYGDYLEKRGKARKGAEKPVSVAASFRKWSSDFKWDDRCKTWDLEAEAREQETRIQDDRDAYFSEIKAFREFQIEEGKSAVQASIAVKKLLEQFLATVTVIENLDQAEKLARIGKFLEGGAEIWAKGLSIEHILQDLLSGT